MSLKMSVPDFDDVPRVLRGDYERGADGAYHLVLEGKHPDAARLAEFRDHNIALLKEVEALRGAKANTAEAEELRQKLAAFEGVDPEEYRVLKARPDATKLEADLIAERAAHQKTQFRHTITTASLGAGVRESARDYVCQEAEKIFAPDGTTQEMSTTNPGTPLTISEWLQSLSRTADWLFLPSRGGGAGPRSETHVLGAIRQQNELRDPTPQQLGAHASEIASGKLKVVYS